MALPPRPQEVDDFGLPIPQYNPTPEPGPPRTPMNEKETASVPPRDRVTKAPSPSRAAESVGAASSARQGGGNQPKTDGKTDDGKMDGKTYGKQGNAAETRVGGGLHDVADDEQPVPATTDPRPEDGRAARLGHSRGSSTASSANINMSEYSHQGLTSQKQQEVEANDDGWQTMPAYAPYDLYDDDDRLVAREHQVEDDEKYAYAGLGGAGQGYTKVVMDDDVESATSMDDNTQYLFQEANGTSAMDDDRQRDAVSQMQATKGLLTEVQKIAYVGLARLAISEMVRESEGAAHSKATKNQVRMAAEGFKMWGQKMMIRLYTHMEISPDEQVMIEQLDAHGVLPHDLRPVLMANARVKNPMAEERAPNPSSSSSSSSSKPASASMPSDEDEWNEAALPAYENHDAEDMEDVKTPSQMPTTASIDIDIRWTILCDLFLVLIADSIYDSRSRVLLERIGQSLEVPGLDICRFERKVTDALEMQQAAEKENWNEADHMETRRRLALRRRYVMMGLATVGGGLVIGLSAGLLAPVIGAGLAAGFATFGVAGTNTFLAGSAGAAIITSSAAASGSYIGGKAANKRTGAVKTFEYRPLHNNKRVNLIITVSGWLTGKVDDVRLPFSTVDSIMGDIYSVLWEPEILRSIGDTINILATEALTQGLQQVLGSTILMGLMAALQLPIVLTKLSYLIDNPWAVSLDRATAAGLILADSLIDRNLGTRPITLVGYSLGSRVIFSCLKELARKGAHGLIQNVFLFGSPVVVRKDEYLCAKTVVAGRFLNGYNRNDWILGYLFRLTSGGISRVAGLAPIDDMPWIENMDVTEFVAGHMDYRRAMPRLLRESGWLVQSDEFTEIEDPDPDDHAQRQRELISEIEEARREYEASNKKQAKGVLGFFGRKKKGEKQEWEVYEDSAKAKEKERTKAKAKATTGYDAERPSSSNASVLFDVEAIRAELARDAQAEDFSIREIESTLPPVRLDIKKHRVSWAPHSATPESPSTPRGPSLSTATPPRVSIDRTPTMASVAWSRQQRAASPYCGAGDAAPGDEIQMDEIQMSFEPAQAPHRATGDASSFSTGGFSSSSSPPQLPLASKHASPPPPTRPDLKTSRTVPNIMVHDPWGDPDDEDFGKEKEIELTFA